MDKNLKNLKKIDIFERVLRLAKAKKRKVYLVGGYLRDLILNRPKEILDLDFAIDKDSIKFSHALAKKLKADFVILDKAHGSTRIIYNDRKQKYILDFTDFRGKNLIEDLRYRDFTINALAIDLEKIKKANNFNNLIIDLSNGRVDLAKKQIKITDRINFDDDPLRILRAFSLSATLGFKIEKNTLALIKKKKNLIKNSAFERIREELFKILKVKNSLSFLKTLDEIKLLSKIIPEIELMRGVKQGPYHHLDVWFHSIETLRQLELLFEELKHKLIINKYLNDKIGNEHSRRDLMKLGALFHDIGKPQTLKIEKGRRCFHGHERLGYKITKDICQRLKLSNKEIDTINKMIFCHLRPGYLADTLTPTKRAVFRYFRDAGEEGISTLLLSIADKRSTCGKLTSKKNRQQHEKIIFGLISEYFLKKKEKQLPRLINGDDLIKEFKLQPGPSIGKILREVEEIQAIGKIHSKKEALDLAEKILNKIS